MTETFYRLHSNPEAPCFCADHAYSGLWGREWSTDGSQTRCLSCDGTGQDDSECTECAGAGIVDYENDTKCSRCAGNGYVPTCRIFHGTGWEDAVRGYSCCRTPEELLAYMAEHACGLADDEKVLVFEGDEYGIDFDGEPTVIPTQIMEIITWGELRKRVSA